MKRTMKQKLQKCITALLCAAMCISGMLGVSPVTANATQSDSQDVHVYTDTPGDTLSGKYTLTANGTNVPVIKYSANGNNFDIARFASNDTTPVYTVTVTDTIETVTVYPERYYPQDSITISEDKHSVTFELSENLRYCFVMINGGPEDQAGRPYLAIINDPLENEEDIPDPTAANVLNFKTFAEEYLKEHPNSAVQKAEEAGTTSGGVSYDAGELVANDTADVRFPNKRIMSADDVTYALQAALDKIYEEGSPYDTLYIPAGTYTWSGLEIRERNGKDVLIYVEEGALLKNRIQECTQAMEPAIGIWDSSNITISGRGIFDGNGVANYKKDRHDAKDSCHQGGVMIVRSSNITFNDTYVRDAKQWNWESHGSKNCTLNNIKGLTPYNQPWVDGLDMASAQDLTINGALTLGNDDCFASGHYNPSDGFTSQVPGYDQYNKDCLEWDVEDSKNVSVNNTLGWSYSGGNGTRLGHNTYGHKMINYTFTNLNAVNFTGGGNGITVQNGTGNGHPYPYYENLQFINCSYDTTRVGTNVNINGLSSTDQIENVTLQNCWFSNGDNGNYVSNVENLKITELYMGGERVEYSNQANLTNTEVTTFINDWEENNLPVITYPDVDKIDAYAGNPLIFSVKAEDEDLGDVLTFGEVDTSEMEGAVFDPSAGKFSWTPSESDIGNQYEVTFTVYDSTGQSSSKTVNIQVNSSGNSMKSYTVYEDAHVQTWKTEKNQKYGSKDFLSTALIANKGLFGQNFTNTSETDTTDGKVIFLKFDLSEIKEQEGLFDKAQLALTYIEKRNTSFSGNDETRLRVAAVNDDSWSESTVTWNTKPTIDVQDDDVVQSETFNVGTYYSDQSKFSSSMPLDSTVPASNTQKAVINGTVVKTDITDILNAAIEDGKDYLTLVVSCVAEGKEIYFISKEGAENFTNATADMAPSILLNLPTKLDIEGPDAMTIYTGYDSAESNSFTLKGEGNFDVTLSGNTGDGKITWDNTTQQIKVASGLSAGEYPVTITVKNSDNTEKTHTFTLTVVENQLTKIMVSAPTKVDYRVGETIDLTGMTVRAAYLSGQTSDITAEVIEDAENAVKGFRSDTAGVQPITVSYGGETASFNVNVRVLSAVRVETAPEKTNYILGDSLNTEGMKVMAVYTLGDASNSDNEMEYDVTDEILADTDAISGFDSTKAGSMSLSVNYQSKTAQLSSVTVADELPEGAVLSELQLKAPVKTDYVVGDSLDLTGLEVVGVYMYNGVSLQHELTGYVTDNRDTVISGFDSSAASESQTVTVTVEDKTAQFAVRISEESVQPTLSRIEVTAPAQTEYNVGAELNLEGMVVTAYYSDGTSADVTNEITGDSITGFDSSKAGTEEITVTYGDKSATFTVTIKDSAPVLAGIRLTAPSKTEYMTGDALDLSGMKVTAVYDDGTEEDVTALVQISGYDSSVTGDCTVSVSYGDFTQTFVVNVVEKPAEDGDDGTDEEPGDDGNNGTDEKPGDGGNNGTDEKPGDGGDNGTDKEPGSGDDGLNTALGGGDNGGTDNDKHQAVTDQKDTADTQSDGTARSSQTSASAKTGDANHAAGYGVLILLAGIAAVFAAKKKFGYKRG